MIGDCSRVVSPSTFRFLPQPLPQAEAAKEQLEHLALEVWVVECLGAHFLMGIPRIHDGVLVCSDEVWRVRALLTVIAKCLLLKLLVLKQFCSDLAVLAASASFASSAWRLARRASL